MWFDNPNDVRVVAGTYQFFTDGVPTAAGFEFLIESPTNTTDLNDPFYAQFNQENRFINFANNLGSFGAGQVTFQAQYGALSFEQTIRQAYDEIIGVDEATAAGIDVEAAIAFFISSFSFYQAVALERVVPAGVPVDQAVKVVAVGSIINEAIKAGLGRYAEAISTLVADVAPDGASPLLGQNILGPAPGAEFILTPGQDFADQAGSFRNGSGNPFTFQFTGTANETVTATNLTLTAGDALSDSSTTDTDLLQITASGATALDLQTVSNLESIEVDFTNYSAVNVNFNGVTGADTLDLDGTLAVFTNLNNVNTTGLTLVDGSGLTSTANGFFISFSGATDLLSRTILGSEAGDALSGSQVGDTLTGNEGTDFLDGFGGNDVLRGGIGNDTIVTGGGTTDRIVFEADAETNGEDFIFTGGAINFTVGINGDQLDFSLFTGGSASVLEVPINAVGGDGVVATANNVIIFDFDADIDTEAELENLVGNDPGDILIGPDRNVVVLIDDGVDTEVYYVETNGAGEVSTVDVDLVAILDNQDSANFVAGNFF